MDKEQHRRQARKIRDQLWADDAIGQAVATTRICGFFLEHLRSVSSLPLTGCTIALFRAIGSEIDLRGLEGLLAGPGIQVALPRIEGPDQPLRFCRHQEGDLLVDGGFGTKMPAPDAPDVRPDIIVVPLLAFDRQGGRIGYGGGFYDRTVAALLENKALPSPQLFGLAFAGQETDGLPKAPHDLKLDYIITENGVL